MYVKIIDEDPSFTITKLMVLMILTRQYLIVILWRLNLLPWKEFGAEINII